VFDRNRSQPDRYEAPQPPASPNPTPSVWGAPAAQPAARLPGAVSTTGVVAREGFLTLSFVWMFLALLVSAAAAFVVMSNQTALEFVARNFFILFIVELGFVLLISAAINRIGAIPALGFLFAYAVLNGATISLVVLGAMRSSSGLPGVLSAFLGASAIFGGAALYGAVTKRDLTGVGGILFMGLIGLIVVSLLNAFIFPSGTLSFAIGIVGVLIFTGLTAYDVQRINKGELQWIKSRESASVVGALYLYLDFVNLFLMLLRIFNSRN
jgi:hypothetical protein